MDYEGAVMYLLVLSQDDYEVDLGTFETLEEGELFAQSLPGYSCETVKGEDDYEYIYECLKVESIPDYAEVEFNGHLVPFSRFSFPLSMDVDIFWKEIPFFTEKGRGLIEGVTRVDAYHVSNEEVKTYITTREKEYKRIKDILEKQSYEVRRDFLGSQDGEAILYKTKTESEWHYFLPILPEILKEYTEEKILDSLRNINK